MKTILLAQAMAIFQCPRCRHQPLALAPNKIGCPACTAEYPVENEIPNFLLHDSDAFQRARWVQAQQYEKAFWDARGQETAPANAPGNVYWKKHAEAQYAKYRHYHDNQPPGICLEIGGGSVPRIYHVPATLKLALDPLMSHEEKLYPAVYENILSLEAMAEAIPLVDNCVDYVVMSNCLDHFSQPELALREVFRVLRPTGLVFISLETFTPLWQLWAKYRDKCHPFRWTAAEQHALINQSGGKIVDYEVNPPAVREWHAAMATSWRLKLAIHLRKLQESWLFARKS
jgi:SAM-dependent methyltransferase